MKRKAEVDGLMILYTFNSYVRMCFYLRETFTKAGSEFTIYGSLSF